MIEPQTDRQCGKCSLCCKLLHVIELQKPANKWCGYCRPGAGGCTIYQDRPQICRSYFCGWMLSKQVGEEWYPLRSHMVLSLGNFDGVQMVTVTVDPKYPNVWCESLYYKQLKNMALSGLRVQSAEEIHLVQVRVSNRVWLILPNRDIEITNCSYVVKLIAPGIWDVEQFATQHQAQLRVTELTGANPH